MTSDISYTIGILLAILIVMFFLRSIFVRRARHAQQLALLTMRPAPITRTTYFGQHARVDVSRPATVLRGGAGRIRTPTGLEEQLPRYEAPPPGYDTVFKNSPRLESQTTAHNGGMYPGTRDDISTQTGSPCPDYEQVGGITARTTEEHLPQAQPPRSRIIGAINSPFVWTKRKFYGLKS